jgi:ketosteroid isomerase-like protein
MPQLARVQAFIALVEAGDYLAAMEEFYHPDATMQENLGQKRAGLAAMIAGERAALARGPIVARKVERFAVEGDHVFINWVFEMTRKAKTSVLDEIAVQTWRGEKIATERFYYDPSALG